MLCIKDCILVESFISFGYVCRKRKRKGERKPGKPPSDLERREESLIPIEYNRDGNKRRGANDKAKILEKREKDVIVGEMGRSVPKKKEKQR